MPEHRDQRSMIEQRIDARLREAFGQATRQDGGIDWDRLRRLMEDVLTDELQGLWALILLLWWRTYSPPQFAGQSPGPPEAARRALEYARQRAEEVAADFVRNAREAYDKLPQAHHILTNGRAQRIATTEVTRAIVDAENSAADELGKASLETITRTPFWTIQDADACPICYPLHGTGRDAWAAQFPTGPPAHPNCRCWLEWMIDVAAPTNS